MTRRKRSVICVFFIAASAASTLLVAAEGDANRDADRRTDAPGSGGAFFATFEQFDTNNDGYLDKGEAAKSAQLKADFDVADTNADKTISRAEWNSYRNIGR